MTNEKVNSLIQDKLEPDISLEREVARNWPEVVNKQYKFHRFLLEVDVLKSLTQTQVCEWLRSYTHTGEDGYRQLSVQVSLALSINTKYCTMAAKCKRKELCCK